jgi:uncharacterized protein (DUF1800 family)
MESLPLKRKRVVTIAIPVILLVSAAALLPARRSKQASDRQKVILALNRLTWGIAPGDVEAVERVGLKQWIDAQLHPDRIPENPLLAQKLEPFGTLRMSATQLVQRYPPPGVVMAMYNRRLPLPGDPETRAMVEREFERFRRRQASAGAPNGDAPGAAPKQPAPKQADVAPAIAALLTPQQLAGLRVRDPRARLAAFLALPQPRQDALIDALPRGQLAQLAAWGPPQLQRRIEVRRAPQMIVSNDLTQAKILRAVYTDRQLQDVLTDFWFNHFNVFIGKGADQFLTTSFERQAIRPHVLGRFYDLLLATAQSPAMLFYLDNWQSVDPAAAQRLAQRQMAMRRQRFAYSRANARARMLGDAPLGVTGMLPPPSGVPGMLAPPAPAVARRRGPQRGINENYGREIMELHTIGVDGGYTQADVIAVARCFTGWTIRQVNRDPEFFYNDRLHDKGEKIVLGHRIKAGGGMNDGLEVLNILASSPATAHHISYELAQRFVADRPPESLVRKMAASYLHSDGDLRRVMQTMLSSPEFWDPQYSRAKIKSPFELVVGALRATGAQVTNATALAGVIARMGEPLYRDQPPNGYSNVGQTWASSSGLVARMNFALNLAANRIPGVSLDLAQLVTDGAHAGGESGAPIEAPPTAGALADALIHNLLFDQASPATRAAVINALTQPAPPSGAAHSRVAAASLRSGIETARAEAPPISAAQLQVAAGLVLGSPDFQRR